MTSSSGRYGEADPREQSGWLHPLIGTSPPFVRMMTVIDQIAGSSEPVLLVGEGGTGKGLLAQTLHERSADSPTKPYARSQCIRRPEMSKS
jgi:transcriptional regulator with PAS, ATPase and Fis domain